MSLEHAFIVIVLLYQAASFWQTRRLVASWRKCACGWELLAARWKALAMGRDDA